MFWQNQLLKEQLIPGVCNNKVVKHGIYKKSRKNAGLFYEWDGFRLQGRFFFVVIFVVLAGNWLLSLITCLGRFTTSAFASFSTRFGSVIILSILELACENP
jgi:hypothetical protein